MGTERAGGKGEDGNDGCGKWEVGFGVDSGIELSKYHRAKNENAQFRVRLEILECALSPPFTTYPARFQKSFAFLMA